ncbi:hypothetical protein [Burkholderia sp. BCC1977]|uniref:hypothetical protein n=1 Tax=Burkholderia sp. BCC1977 TaxID=2817440 RepID=UPI002ABDB5F4|nr:hypothetical protein [Burkholderia sp. BCC1977]
MNYGWIAMRFLCLSILAAMGFSAMSVQVIAAECPLELTLKSDPDAFINQLKSLPTEKSERTVDRPPIFGHCNYQTSSVMQLNATPGGLCSIGGQPVMMSMVSILDSRSTVVSHEYLVPKSDKSLGAIKSALSKIGTVVSREAEPKAWTSADSHWLVDAVYGSREDLWTVAHEVPDQGENRSPHDFYIVTHVRREWLDFSNRDLNTCAPLPGGNRPDAGDVR